MRRSSRRLHQARRSRWRGRKVARLALGMCACVVGQPALPADNPAEALELQSVEVIGTTPLPGLGTPLKDVPANVQVYGSKELGKQRPGSLAEFLEINPTSVTVNAAQGNPYQPDISFRGFTASPLRRRAARSVGVPGRRAHQRALRRRRQLGPAAAVGDRQHPAHPRLEPAVRPQHAGRRARDLHQERRASSPAARSSSRADRSAGARCRSSRAAPRARGTSSSPATSPTTTAGPSTTRAAIAQFFGKLGYQTDATTSTQPDPRRQPPRRHADASAVVPGRRRQAYTYPDINKNRSRCSRSRAATSSTTTCCSPATPISGATATQLSSNVNDNFGEVDPDTGVVDAVQALNDRSRIDQTSSGGGLQLTLRSPGRPGQPVRRGRRRGRGKGALPPGIPARELRRRRGARFPSATSRP